MNWWWPWWLCDYTTTSNNTILIPNPIKILLLMLTSKTDPTNTDANTAMWWLCTIYNLQHSYYWYYWLQLQFYNFWFQLFHCGPNVLHLFISDFLISYFAISALRFTAVSFCLSSQTENLNRRIKNFDCFVFTFS